MDPSENSTTGHPITADQSLETVSSFEKGKSFYRQAKLKEALKCFQEAATNLSDQPRELIEVNLRISQVFYDEAQADESIEILDRTLEICKNNFEEDDPIIAKVYNALAQTSRYKMKYELSYQQCLKALKINEKRLSLNDIEIGRCYHTLGICFMTLEKIEDAKMALNKALKIKEKYTGDDRDMELGLTYQRLSNLYSVTGEYDSATQGLEQSLNLLQKYYNCDHPHVIHLYSNLADLYEHLGELQKAQKYYTALLQSSLLLYGECHDHSAKAYKGLGDVYYALTDYKAAEDHLLRALEIFKKLFGEIDIDVSSTYASLCRVMFDQKEYVKGLKYIYKALLIAENKMGGKDSLTSGHIKYLQIIMSRLNMLEGALKSSLRVLLCRRKVYGEKHFYFVYQFRDAESIESCINLYQVKQDI